MNPCVYISQHLMPAKLKTTTGEIATRLESYSKRSLVLKLSSGAKRGDSVNDSADGLMDDFALSAPPFGLLTNSNSW